MNNHKICLIILQVTFQQNWHKPALNDLLVDELKGSHCVPALLFEEPFQEIKWLQNYETLPTEGLHTITGHIKNIYQEAPQHLKDHNEKKKFLKVQSHIFHNG